MISGVTGFVGQNLAEHPGMKRHEVLTGDRHTLRDSESARAEFYRRSPDLIVHLAGRVGGIQANLADPVNFLVDNLEMGFNCVMGAWRAGVPKLINLGSSCMYPVKAPQPFREESLGQSPVEPTNEAYAMAKLTVAALCRFLNESHGTAYKTLIPPGIYGPHAHFEGDRAHLVGAVMARLHKAKLAGDAEAPIWSDGQARREFLFAGDLADCIVRAIDEFDSLPEVMNVGTGYDLSVDQWSRTNADAVGYRGKFRHDLSKPSGAPAKVMDVSRAAEWGWTAPTSLADGLRQTYEWYLKNA